MKRIYLVTRLYNTADKLRTLQLESAIRSSLPHIETYLPYRDSDEENITGDWKTTIFNMDIAELNACDSLVGYWDGPSFDEGIGFEIGYSLVKGKEIIIVNDDFLSYQYRYNNALFKFNDPIVDKLLSNVVYVPLKMNSPEQFGDDLLEVQDKIHTEIISKLENHNPNDLFIEGINRVNVSVYIETSFSKLVYEKAMAMSHSVVCSQRFHSSDIEDSTKRDIENAIAADTMYVVANGMNLPPGTSMLCGIRYALNKDTYIVQDKDVSSLSMTNAIMPVNLMVGVSSRGYISWENLIKEVT